MYCPLIDQRLYNGYLTILEQLIVYGILNMVPSLTPPTFKCKVQLKKAFAIFATYNVQEY